jgi:hypothetical protein
MNDNTLEIFISKKRHMRNLLGLKKVRNWYGLFFVFYRVDKIIISSISVQEYHLPSIKCCERTYTSTPSHVLVGGQTNLQIKG